MVNEANTTAPASTTTALRAGEEAGEHAPTPWADEQDAHGVPVIEQTYLARIPNGDLVEVNRFDYNINCAAGTLDKYIQLENAAWIAVRNITLLTPHEQRAAISKATGGQS